MHVVREFWPEIRHPHQHNGSPPAPAAALQAGGKTADETVAAPGADANQ
jgi:hypothetical protein